MTEAPYAYAGLDRIFHERARLGIVTSLAGHANGLGFSELRTLCGLTDGNLNRHLQVLEEAGFVTLEKGYEGKRPLTVCRLTDRGRESFAAYIDVLSDVVHRAQQSGAQAAVSSKSKGKPA